MSFKLGFGVSKDKRTKKSVKYKDGVLPGQKSPDHSARDSPQEAPQGQYNVLYVQEVVSVKYKDGVLPGQKSPDHSARDSPQEAPQGQYTVLYVQEVVPFFLMNILCKLNMASFLDILYYSYKNAIRPVYSGIIILA